MKNFEMKDIERVTVSFSKKNDEELFKFCCENSIDIGKKFASFVKEVLREKMNQSEPIEEMISRKIEEYLKNKNVKIEEKAITKFEKEDKNALLNFMKKK